MYVFPRINDQAVDQTRIRPIDLATIRLTTLTTVRAIGLAIVRLIGRTAVSLMYVRTGGGSTRGDHAG